MTQRVKVPQRAQHGGPAALSGAPSGLPDAGAAQRAAAAPGATQEHPEGGQAEGFWKVVLDGIQISYDVEEGSRDVVLRSATLA